MFVTYAQDFRWSRNVSVRDTVQEPSAYFRRATEALEDERRRVEEEQAAFEAFGDAVVDLDGPASKRPTDVPGSSERCLEPITVTDGGRTDSATRVEELYRETVLETASANEFDETVAEHMAEEFGAEVSRAVFGGSALGRRLRSALVEGARAAIRERQEIIGRIERERRVLTDAQNRLEDISDERRDLHPGRDSVSLGRLYSRRNRVLELSDSCDELAADRQRSLRVTLYDDYRYRSFVRYLYRRCSFGFPILSGAAALAASLRETRTRIDDRIVGTRDEGPHNA